MLLSIKNQNLYLPNNLLTVILLMKDAMVDLCILPLLGYNNTEELNLGIIIHIRANNKLVNSTPLKPLSKLQDIKTLQLLIWLMLFIMKDLFLLHSMQVLESNFIMVVFLILNFAQLMLTMLFQQLDTELLMELIIGRPKTHGEQFGEKEDISKLLEALTNVELKISLLFLIFNKIEICF